MREALVLIEQNWVQVAVLDVNLSDRDVTPVAELLIEGGVPVIFYSGLDLPAALRERYPSAPAYKKPTPSLRLLNELATLISGSRRALAGQLLQMLLRTFSSGMPSFKNGKIRAKEPTDRHKEPDCRQKRSV